MTKNKPNKNSNWIVLKLGGSVLYTDLNKLNVPLLIEWKTVVNQLKKQFNVAIVMGGGKLSRSIVNICKDHLSIAEMDQVSIDITKLHARIASYLFECHFVHSYEELFDKKRKYRSVVTGGFYPGQSTNGAAATVAEILEVRWLVNLFSYNYVMDINPEEKKGKKSIKRMSYQRLRELNQAFLQLPGHYELFDHQATTICERSKIPLVFLNGKSPKHTLNFFNGKSYGTIVGEENIGE